MFLDLPQKSIVRLYIKEIPEKIYYKHGCVERCTCYGKLFCFDSNKPEHEIIQEIEHDDADLLEYGRFEINVNSKSIDIDDDLLSNELYEIFSYFELGDYERLSDEISSGNLVERYELAKRGDGPCIVLFPIKFKDLELYMKHNVHVYRDYFDGLDDADLEQLISNGHIIEEDAGLAVIIAEDNLYIDRADYNRLHQTDFYSYSRSE